MTRSAPRARDALAYLSAWPCACCAPSAQAPHNEPAIADDAIPADETVADKEPTVADKEPAVADDAIRADKEKKEKQHAEIVAKRHKAALAKKKRECRCNRTRP